MKMYLFMFCLLLLYDLSQPICKSFFF